ncbi:MAG: DUF5666 domain-containing protein [Candidatus Shapirobacteria bacterium]
MFFPFYFLILFFSPSQALAISPSPTVTVLPSPTTTDQLDDIQKIRDVVKQKVQEKLKEITSPVNTKKAFIGTVIQIDQNQLTLSFQNDNKKILVAADTTYIDLKRNKSSLAKINVGQDILVMGYLNNQGSLDAKRIVFIDLKVLTPSPQITVGKIVDISKSSPTLVLIPSQNKNDQYQIKTTDKTEIIDPQSKKITFASLKTGQRVIAIINPDPKNNKNFTAQRIIVFIEATTPTPSPSITPKATPKLTPTN